MMSTHSRIKTGLSKKEARRAMGNKRICSIGTTATISLRRTTCRTSLPLEKKV